MYTCKIHVFKLNTYVVLKAIDERLEVRKFQFILYLSILLIENCPWPRVEIILYRQDCMGPKSICKLPSCVYLNNTCFTCELKCQQRILHKNKQNRNKCASSHQEFLTRNITKCQMFTRVSFKYPTFQKCSVLERQCKKIPY